MTASSGHPIRVLLVEDNPNEVQLAEMALSRTGVFVEIEHVSNGSDAVTRLLQGGPLPDLVLLDLNLPLRNGEEVLRAIRPALPKGVLRVVIYTTSAKEEDRTACLDAGCDEYHVKPMGFADTVQLLNFLLGGSAV